MRIQDKKLNLEKMNPDPEKVVPDLACDSLTLEKEMEYAVLGQQTSMLWLFRFTVDSIRAVNTGEYLIALRMFLF